MGALREKAYVDQHPPVNAFDPFLRYLLRQFVNYEERIGTDSFAISPAVGVVFVFEAERTIRLDSAREVGVSARNQDDVAFQRPVGCEFAGTIDPRVETIICAEKVEGGSFSD